MKKSIPANWPPAVLSYTPTKSRHKPRLRRSNQNCCENGCSGSWATSPTDPYSSTVPSRGANEPRSVESNVDFPAPLAPSKAVTCPRGTSRSTADAFIISENTVRTHVKHLYAKLDVHTRQELLDRVELVEHSRDE